MYALKAAIECYDRQGHIRFSYQLPCSFTSILIYKGAKAHMQAISEYFGQIMPPPLKQALYLRVMLLNISDHTEYKLVILLSGSPLGYLKNSAHTA